MEKLSLDPSVFQWQTIVMLATHPLTVWFSSAPIKRRDFALNVGCSPAHLTLITQWKRGVSLELALNIQRETGGVVTVEQLLRAKQPAEAS